MPTRGPSTAGCGFKMLEMFQLTGIVTNDLIVANSGRLNLQTEPLIVYREWVRL